MAAVAALPGCGGTGSGSTKPRVQSPSLPQLSNGVSSAVVHAFKSSRVVDRLPAKQPFGRRLEFTHTFCLQKTAVVPVWYFAQSPSVLHCTASRSNITLHALVSGSRAANINLRAGFIFATYPLVAGFTMFASELESAGGAGSLAPDAGNLKARCFPNVQPRPASLGRKRRSSKMRRKSVLQGC